MHAPASSRHTGAFDVLNAVFKALRGLATAFTNGMLRIYEANEQKRQYERLATLSDAELAQRGLDRDGLVRAVFAGYLV